MKRAFCLGVLSLLVAGAEAQVNPQSGAATVSIPLYSYTDAGNRLGVSASLIYIDGNGLKPSEMASAVGTGWVLNCGGEIDRIQHGEPDDQFMSSPPDSTDIPNYTANYYPNGYLYTSYPAKETVNNAAAYSAYQGNFVPASLGYRQSPDVLADRDQDYFQFSFNGRSGTFVIGRNGQVRTQADSKLKISFQTTDMSGSGIRTRISKFTITDESGIQYVYSDMELGYVCSYTDFRKVISDNADVSQLTNLGYSLINDVTNDGSAVNLLLGETNGSLVANKWYLSAIVNPFSGKQVTFNYDTYEEDLNTSKSLSMSVSGSNSGDVTCTWQRHKIRGKRLSSVILSSNERIDLIYSTSPRIDLPHQNALSQLQVSYKGNAIYSWQFGYGYMVGIDMAIKSPTYSYSPAEIQWGRLCLTSLTKTGTSIVKEAPYHFDYYLGGDNNANADVVPPMFSIYQDHWGYYNAGIILTTGTEGSDKSFYPIAGLSTLVRNGLGVYKNAVSAVAKNGILKSITTPLGGVTTYTYERNTIQGRTAGGVRVSQTASYDGISHTNDVIQKYEYVLADGTTSSGWGGETLTYTQSGSLFAQGCGSKQTPAAIIKYAASNYIQSSIFGSVGALQSSVLATGADFADMLGPIGIAIVAAVLIYETGNQAPPDITSTYTQYLNQAMEAGNPLPWGYSRTVVTNLLSTDNVGKTVYEFSYPGGAQDAPLYVSTLAVAYSNSPRFAPWAYGLPKTVSIFDKSGTILKQTINNYTYFINPLQDDNFCSKSWTTTGTNIGCTRYTVNTGTNQIIQEIYYPLVGHAQLNSTNIVVYNGSQQSATVTSNYEYDDHYQLKDQSFTNSKGQIIKTYYFYPYSYPNAAGSIALLNTNGIVSPVLSTESYIQNTDGPYMIAATASDFSQTSNGDVKPSASYAFQSQTPVIASSLQAPSLTNVVRDPAYYKQISAYAYDAYGNVVQTVSGGNKIVSTIFDYDGKLAVATAYNASYNDIGYSSFEAEGGKSGSWLNTAAITSSDARTGKYSFNLSDGSNTQNGYFGFGNLNSSLNYVVSFWSKGGSTCLNGSKAGAGILSSCQGSAGWKQGATVNGWTYYELQANNIDQISVSGTGLIDEFRIYPVGAQMTTTTYSPRIGKTSECDVSNRITYYEYDTLGRLRYEKDDKGNITRMYDYNYKQ